MKEEALKLANELSQYTINDGVDDLNKRTIAMIRRLVKELEELKHNNEELLKCLTAERKQSEPDYFILTQDHTWLSCDEDFYNKAKPTHKMKCYTTPQTKPLSDEEIMGISHQALEGCGFSKEFNFMVVFARAIEERHGIK